jgi:hypothetical protein
VAPRLSGIISATAEAFWAHDVELIARPAETAQVALLHGGLLKRSFGAEQPIEVDT